MPHARRLLSVLWVARVAISRRAPPPEASRSKKKRVRFVLESLKPVLFRPNRDLMTPISPYLLSSIFRWFERLPFIGPSDLERSPPVEMLFASCSE